MTLPFTDSVQTASARSPLCVRAKAQRARLRAPPNSIRILLVFGWCSRSSTPTPPGWPSLSHLRLRRADVLGHLDRAQAPVQFRPGYSLHPLKGDLKGMWSPRHRETGGLFSAFLTGMLSMLIWWISLGKELPYAHAKPAPSRPLN